MSSASRVCSRSRWFSRQYGSVATRALADGSAPSAGAGSAAATRPFTQFSANPSLRMPPGQATSQRRPRNDSGAIAARCGGCVAATTSWEKPEKEMPIIPIRRPCAHHCAATVSTASYPSAAPTGPSRSASPPEQPLPRSCTDTTAYPASLATTPPTRVSGPGTSGLSPHRRPTMLPALATSGSAGAATSYPEYSISVGKGPSSSEAPRGRRTVAASSVPSRIGM